MAEYLRARELNPNDAEVLAEMSNFLVYVGQPKQAIDQLKKAIPQTTSAGMLNI